MHTSQKEYNFLKALIYACVFALLLCATGCPQKTITMQPGQQTPKPPKTTQPKAPQETGQEAPFRPTTPKEFYELGDYAKAEQMAGDLIAKPNLPAAERSEAWHYYILSAAANNHLHLADQALTSWAEQEPGIENSTAWQDAWLDTTSRFQAFDARQKAQARSADTYPLPMQARAQAVLALHAASAEEQGEALANMQGLQTRLSRTEKASLESAFARQLWRLDGQNFTRMYGHINSTNAGVFPYTIINLEQGRRLLASSNQEQKSAGQQILQSLVNSGVLANPPLAESLLQAATAQESALQISPENIQSQGTVALLLPMKGQYATLANKISQGATAAQHALARTGVGATVIIIDTESPDWQQKVAALPPATLLGGPMTPTAFEQGKTSGLFAGRAVFTFLPQLGPGEEGVTAWRFFTSPQDQINTLLKFCRDDLGIHGVGSLYPSDSYGQRMNTALSQEAGNYGISTTSTAYSPDAPAEWNNSVRSFLRSGANSSFNAAFIPDTWSNAKALVPYIFYNQEDRLVLMGTALWEQNMNKGRNPDASYFYLGVFPGAWNSEAPSPAKDSLISILSQMSGGALNSPERGAGPGGADLWVALGFDFVRFAMYMGQPDSSAFAEVLDSMGAGAGGGPGGGWTAEQVNSHISSAQGMDWSMAPLSWTSNGLVSQQMYLFTPTEDGFAPVNVAEFKQRIEKTKSMHDQRWKSK